MDHCVKLLTCGFYFSSFCKSASDRTGPVREETLVDEGTPGHLIIVKSVDTPADPDDAHRGHE